ncbi:MAG: DEAD/DEAH box helicase [Verrucomicrobiia bacterium]
MNTTHLASEIEKTYRCYLQTTFYFKDPVLRRSFEEALNVGHLSKGPYLEATPVFKRGTKASNLFEELLQSKIDPGFLKAIEGDRPLYHHQEQSIRSVFSGHNVVVATGTGSGKTEAFLYPILLHLYQEFKSGTLGPGVRALVLYPMNAVANDQCERLGNICARLKTENSPFHVTFGQYIGETPENENDSKRHARDHISRRDQKGHSIIRNNRVIHGELVLRSEMRITPPHILLTNYSMLEYLLLRPDDSPLFDNGQARWWTFLILDEAHQYRGAKGIEMAMLLRRLKQRLREGGRESPFRCIATSATLAGGDRDKPAVAEFATNLFGEPFEPQDIILGETEPIPESGTVRFNRDDYCILSRIFEGDEQVILQISSIGNKYGIAIPTNEKPERVVGKLLKNDKRSTELRRLITGNPQEVHTIAEQIFNDLPQQERVAALSELIVLLLRAEDPTTGARLLSARYHLFLRSLEGAFLSINPEKKVVLDRRRDGDSEFFEIALCRECGQHYIVGNIVNGKLVEAVRDPGREDFGATFFLPLEDSTFEEDDNDDGVNIQNIATSYKLCSKCREIRRATEKLRCGHGVEIHLLKQEQAKEKEDQIPRCVVCGYQARDPVREVVHGTDGPHAVIATTLYKELPKNRRKILAFADGRQEAAFFAWYLEKSYKDILSRNLILRVIQTQALHSSEGSSIQDLATGLRDLFRQNNVFPPATSELQLKREAWLALYREFLTDEPRISLEGVGLACWKIQWPPWFSIPDVFTKAPWSLSDEEARNLVFILLDTVRTDHAVEIHTEDGISLKWTDLSLQTPQMCVSPVDAGKLNKNERKWAGKTGRRVKLLEKLYKRIHAEASEQEAVNEALRALRVLWDTLWDYDNKAPTADDRLLIRINDSRRLNPDWWRLRYIRDSEEIYQCDTCGRVQPVSVHSMCPRHRCPGALKKVLRGALESNHYRLLYEMDLPGSLRVEEHTAQLNSEKAREFQGEFREGKIHILSCSTTFELGVDLGDLDTIFLRNVPPEAFNYAQRVGRSGRRSGYPGFAITYCKRGSHDLYHFAEPQRMLTGKNRPPVISIRNEKIVTRHMVAVALSFFFRAFKERFLQVRGLLKDLETPTAVSDFKEFLKNRQSLIEETLRQIVPSEITTKLGLDDGSWIEKITGEDSRFALAEAEVSSDYKAVRNLEQIAGNARDYKTAEWAKKRAETIASEDVLSFLSRKAVIPKYGFPVDVVELDTQQIQQNQEGSDVSLQRDLSIAISEFAPTSKLVANKKEWTSYGLKKVAGREWDRRRYARCSIHSAFKQWNESESFQDAMLCGCKLQTRKYIIPLFGFVTERDKPKEPKNRPPKVFSTRPYFVRSLEKAQNIELPASSPMISLTKASPGIMVVLCEGRLGAGFYVCLDCGAGFSVNQRPPHKTPQGQKCSGTLENVSLGHEFVTDVLQLQFKLALPVGEEPGPFTLSLAYAIVEGAAEILEVPSTDLNATIVHSLTGMPSIVLYDDVPGGAGLVARLESEDVLKECLQAACNRVDGSCGCAPNTSCYGCLRHYRNQFAHQQLKRGPVYDYLKSLLQKWSSVVLK